MALSYHTSRAVLISVCSVPSCPSTVSARSSACFCLQERQEGNKIKRNPASVLFVPMSYNTAVFCLHLHSVVFNTCILCDTSL